MDEGPPRTAGKGIDWRGPGEFDPLLQPELTHMDPPPPCGAGAAHPPRRIRDRWRPRVSCTCENAAAWGSALRQTPWAAPARGEMLPLGRASRPRFRSRGCSCITLASDPWHSPEERRCAERLSPGKMPR